jgi:catechol 2,3-dioxygenase-like lactoylglutathione lyase family enzyme
MLDKYDLIAFVATKQPDRAKVFYPEILGLRLLGNTPFALVFEAGGTTRRVSKVKEMTPAPYTVLGWKVTDMGSTVTGLANRGITFERYEGMPRDEFGVWTTPDGHLVSWFKDPEGNTLSLTQFRSKVAGHSRTG